MKKLLALTMLSALLLTSCMPQGEDLQGRFGKPTKAWEMTLSPSSPSGSYAVSASDSVLYFDMTLPTDNGLTLGSIFIVSFATDLDLDPLADGTTVSLKDGATTIGTGTFALVDPSNPSEGTAVITTTKAVSLTAGTAKTFTITTNTSEILTEDAGDDDPLTVRVEHNGKSVTGNALIY
ncbi:MAG: hypothetical protein AAB383_03070 [Patescibacteria group bacterium]